MQIFGGTEKNIFDKYLSTTYHLSGFKVTFALASSPPQDPPFSWHTVSVIFFGILFGLYETKVSQPHDPCGRVSFRSVALTVWVKM